MPPDPLQDRANELESLARVCFADLTPSEVKLIRTAPLGKMTDCAAGGVLPAPSPLASETEEWGPDRQVRAELIRWLCVDARAKTLVDPVGINLWNAMVPDSLDLSFVKVAFPLTMVNCRLMRRMNLQAAEIPDLNMHGTHVLGIEASGARVNCNVFLRNGFQSSGEIRLLGTSIGGDLDCSGGRFLNPWVDGAAGSGVAPSADRVKVANGVFLNKGFYAEGEARLLGAQVGGNLSCGGGKFINPTQGQGYGACALSGDEIAVEGSVYMDVDFIAEGGVRIPGAQIGGDLDCSGGRFVNHPEAGVLRSGRALVAEGALIKGCIFFKGLYADGHIDLLGVRIQKNLECIDSTIRGRLGMRGASVGGGFHWLRIRSPELATVLLDDASASRILDDAGSWPSKGNLDLDGFTYSRIAEGPRDNRKRIEWLKRQGDFTPQPYRQLAKVLTEEGDDAGARNVLHEMERTRREKEDGNGFARFWSGTLRWTIGYGYYPGFCLLWLLLLVAVGWPIFRYGYFAGSVTPTEKEAYSDFKKDRSPPAYYGRFYALAYSLENSFPLVKLGETDRWQPDPLPQPSASPAGTWFAHVRCFFVSSGFLLGFRWTQILLGWFFATMGVAGVTGIVRKD